MDEINSYLYIKAKNNKLTIEDIESIDDDLIFSNMMNRSIYFNHIKQFELIINNFNYETLGFDALITYLTDLYKSNIFNKMIFINLIIKTGHIEVIKVCKKLSIEYRNLVS